MGLAIGLDIKLGGLETCFTPKILFVGHAGAWYDPSDLTTLFQADGTTPAVVNGGVGKVLDKSGNGNHMVQVTGTKCPLLKQSGGLTWLEFDGADDFLAKSTINTVQPFNRLTAMRNIGGVFGDMLGADAAGNCAAQYNGGNLTLNADVGAACSRPMTANADVVANAFFNGASSSLQINNGTPATGNPGPAQINSLSAGALDGGGLPVPMRWYGDIFYPGTLTAAQIASVKTWLGGKAGIGI